MVVCPVPAVRHHIQRSFSRLHFALQRTLPNASETDACISLVCVTVVLAKKLVIGLLLH